MATFPLRRFRSLLPFSNAHWILPVVLLIAWELALFEPCRTSPFYFEVVLLTLTVAIAFWATDSHKDALRQRSRLARVLILGVYNLLAFFVLFVLLAIPISLFTPHYTCYTDRAKLMEGILHASNARIEITRRIDAARTVKGSGQGLTIEPGGRASWGWISADGLIVVATEDPVGLAVLRPRWEDGAVKWHCGGWPEKSFPASCREPLPALLE